MAEKISQKVEGQLSKSQKEFLLRQQVFALNLLFQCKQFFYFCDFFLSSSLLSMEPAVYVSCFSCLTLGAQFFYFLSRICEYFDCLLVLLDAQIFSVSTVIDDGQMLDFFGLFRV